MSSGSIMDLSNAWGDPVTAVFSDCYASGDILGADFSNLVAASPSLALLFINKTGGLFFGSPRRLQWLLQRRSGQLETAITALFVSPSEDDEDYEITERTIVPKSDRAWEAQALLLLDNVNIRESVKEVGAVWQGQGRAIRGDVHSFQVGGIIGLSKLERLCFTDETPDFLFDRPRAAVQNGLSRLTNLRSLSLACESPAVACLRFSSLTLLSHLTGLTQLTLYDYVAPDSSDFVSLLPFLKTSLRALKIVRGDPGPDPIVNSSISLLTALNELSVRFVERDSFEAILPSLVNLTSLDFFSYGCSINLKVSDVPNLRKLKAENCKFVSLPNTTPVLSALTELDFSFSTFRRDLNTFVPWTAFPNLLSLKLGYDSSSGLFCPRVDLSIIASLTSLRLLSLTYLSTRNCHALSSLTNLTSLSLHSCPASDSLSSVIPALTKLQELRLERACTIPSEYPELKVMLGPLRRLREVWLYDRCPNRLDLIGILAALLGSSDCLRNLRVGCVAPFNEYEDGEEAVMETFLKRVGFFSEIRSIDLLFAPFDEMGVIPEALDALVQRGIHTKADRIHERDHEREWSYAYLGVRDEQWSDPDEEDIPPGEREFSRWEAEDD